MRFYDPTRSPTQKEMALHTGNKDAAKHLFQEFRMSYFRGKFDPWKDQSEFGISLDDAIPEYVEQEHLRPSSQKAKRVRLTPFARQFPGMLVSGITVGQLKNYCFAPHLKRGTQMSYLYEFKQFLDYCKRHGWTKRNLARELLDDTPRARKRIGRSITQYLSVEQVEQILAAIDFDIEQSPRRIVRHVLKDVIVFAVSTGLRRGEICRLRREHVTLHVPPRITKKGGYLYGWIHVRHDGDDLTKTGDEDRVPVVAASYDLLRRRLSQPSQNGYVFDSPRGNSKLDGDWISKLFTEYRRMAKLPQELHFHSLRHTCASWLAENGADLKVIQEVLRHANIKQTMKYAHLMPDVVAEKAGNALTWVPEHM